MSSLTLRAELGMGVEAAVEALFRVVSPFKFVERSVEQKE